MSNLSKDKLNGIKMIVTDFDGVLSDGYLYLSSNSLEEIKRISFRDIMGLSQAIKKGYKIAIISGEKNAIIDTVANKFKLEDVYQGIKDKNSVLADIARKYSLSMDEICYIGDDINDEEALKNAGVAFTVNNAYYKIKEIPNIFITKANGGEGAFREVLDILSGN